MFVDNNLDTELKENQRCKTRTQGDAMNLFILLCFLHISDMLHGLDTLFH